MIHAQMVKIICGVSFIVLSLATHFVIYNYNQYEKMEILIDKIINIRSLMAECQAAERGYVITHNEKYLSEYYRSIEVIQDDTNKLGNIIPQEDFDIYNRLKYNINKKIAFINNIIGIIQENNLSDNDKLIATNAGQVIVDSIRQDSADLIQLQMDRYSQKSNISTEFAKTTLYVMPLIFIVLYYLISKMEQECVKSRNTTKTSC